MWKAGHTHADEGRGVGQSLRSLFFSTQSTQCQLMRCNFLRVTCRNGPAPISTANHRPGKISLTLTFNLRTSDDLHSTMSDTHAHTSPGEHAESGSLNKTTIHVPPLTVPVSLIHFYDSDPSHQRPTFLLTSLTC